MNRFPRQHSDQASAGGGAKADLTYPIYGQLLRLLQLHRFATTHQVARFMRPEYASDRSALRQSLRQLRALKDAGLVLRLERRIGGWQGGSAVSIWALTTQGHRHLTGSRKRRRPEHLTTGFLEHGLAVTEARLRVEETVRTLPGSTSEVQVEPDCWRRYIGPHGIAVTLKPDLQLTVTSPEYQDVYFIEVDRATENPGRVIRQCWQYEQYRRSGTEQGQYGVYPAVIWVVPNEHRKLQLERAFAEEKQLPRHLFTVITPDELNMLIRDGPPIAS